MKSAQQLSLFAAPIEADSRGETTD